MPRPATPVSDLERFAVVVKEGFAWAGSAYRRSGYGMAMAAEDTESVRRIFLAKLGAPRRTIIHGQSWGGGVAARTIETFNGVTDGRPHYDAALLTSGVLAGNSRAYLYRTDLLAVYRYYCRNLPREGEPDFPVWMGLPADARMTSKDLEARVNECTGAGLPRGERSAAQQRNLDDITRVIRIPERILVRQMDFSVFMWQDIVHKRLGGKNPWSNARVRYTGSSDDEALNKGVPRFEADPEAARQFAADGDMTGKGSIPILTIHAIDDPIIFVEQQSAYKATLEAAGTADRLVQTFTREKEHSYLSTPEYAALLQALMAWVDDKRKPSPASVAGLCEAHARRYEGGCHFDVEFKPQPLEARQHARN
jgi:alpha-beta hydrolase superfamily lysophospholipase